MNIRECFKPALLACLLAFTSACGGSGGGPGGNNPPPGSNPPPGDDNNPPPVADTEPDAFAFEAIDNLFMNMVVISEAVEITGIDASADIAITGGMYAINDQSFTDVPGKISAGDHVRVLTTTDGEAEQTVKAVLEIGSVKGEFNATTGPTVNFADINPELFELSDPGPVEKGKVVTSKVFTVTHINAPAPVSITGGEYRIEKGDFTDAPAVVLPGQRVQVRATAPLIEGAVRVATLRIGGVTEAFTLVTAPVEGALDTIPDGFAFPPVMNVEPRTQIISEEIVVSGLSAAAPITIEGGAYSIGGEFETTPGEVTNGMAVRVRVQSSPVSGGIRIAKVSIGNVPAYFVVTTREIPFGSDAEPDLDSFFFDDEETPDPGALIESEWDMPFAFDAPIEIRVENGEYQIDAGSFTDQPQLMLPGQAIRLRGRAPESIGETNTVTVTAAGRTSDFRIRTVAPDPENRPPNLDNVGIFNIGNEIHLDAAGVVDPDAGDQVESIAWSWVSGPQEPEIVPDGQIVGYATATVTEAGTYEFRVTASDGELESVRTLGITVDPPTGNVPPLAVLTVDNGTLIGPDTWRVDIDDGIVLDAQDSSDFNDDALTFEWFESNDNPAPGEDFIVPRPDVLIFNVPVVGTYTFGVDVSDGTETTTATVTVEVVADEPVEAIVTFEPEAPRVGDFIGFDAGDSTGNILLYTWALLERPDGSNTNIIPFGVTARMTPDMPGTYRVSLGVVQSEPVHELDEVSVTIEVLPQE